MINSCSIVQLFPEESSIRTLYTPGPKLYLSSPDVGSSSHVTVNGSTPPSMLRIIEPSFSAKQEIFV